METFLLIGGVLLVSCSLTYLFHMKITEALNLIDVETKNILAHNNHLNEKYLEKNKALYEARQILERTFEMVDKQRVEVPPEERLERCLAFLRPLTPHGPTNKID